jgi:hypothetical protein
MTTDTPRTDAVQSELEGITTDHVIRALRIFGREKITKDGSLESWINLGAYRLEKAEAEVDRLEDLLNRAINEIEKTPFHTPKLTAFTAHRLADRYREKMTNTSTNTPNTQEDDK